MNYEYSKPDDVSPEKRKETVILKGIGEKHWLDYFDPLGDDFSDATAQKLKIFSLLDKMNLAYFKKGGFSLGKSRFNELNELYMEGFMSGKNREPTEDEKEKGFICAYNECIRGTVPECLASIWIMFLYMLYNGNVDFDYKDIFTPGTNIMESEKLEENDGYDESIAGSIAGAAVIIAKMYDEEPLGVKKYLSVEKVIEIMRYIVAFSNALGFNITDAVDFRIRMLELTGE